MCGNVVLLNGQVVFIRFKGLVKLNLNARAYGDGLSFYFHNVKILFAH
jgi:hypothetical protein